jgi:hypothetical protein
MSLTTMREEIQLDIYIYICMSVIRIECINFRVVHYDLFYFHLSQYDVRCNDAVSNFHSTSPSLCPQQVTSCVYTEETPNERHENKKCAGYSFNS